MQYYHPISILYHGEFIVLGDKPAGLVVHPTLDPNRASFSEELQRQMGCDYLRLVNRLDRDTSGLVMFCIHPEKNKLADQILKEAQKNYLAICGGSFPEGEFRLEAFLKDGKGRVRKVRSGGKKAITIARKIHYSPRENVSLVQASILTGRRHQIRFQLSDFGFPVIGDTTYGKESRLAKRGLLHAYSLEFSDENGRRIRVVSPPPEDFHRIFPDIANRLKTSRG